MRGLILVGVLVILLGCVGSPPSPNNPAPALPASSASANETSTSSAQQSLDWMEAHATDSSPPGNPPSNLLSPAGKYSGAGNCNPYFKTTATEIASTFSGVAAVTWNNEDYCFRLSHQTEADGSIFRECIYEGKEGMWIIIQRDTISGDGSHFIQEDATYNPKSGKKEIRYCKQEPLLAEKLGKVDEMCADPGAGTKEVCLCEKNGIGKEPLPPCL